MTRPSVLWVVLFPPLVLAAPQKEDLPRGAIARLAVVPAAKGDNPPGNVTGLVFLDDRTLFVATGTGWRTWDLEKRQARQEKPVGTPAFAVSREGDRLFVGSARKLHSIEPVQSMTVEPTRSWDATAEAVSILAVAPNGGRVVYSDSEQKLAVLDPRTGKATGVAEFGSEPAAAALTANGRILAVAGRDGTARVYALAADGSLDPLWARRVARSDRMAAQFSPDGRLFAVSSAGRVMVLDSITGRPMQAIERRFGEGDVRCLAFSPDGRHLAVGTNGPNAVVRVTDVTNGSERATLAGHLGHVNAVAFSADGRMLASGGADPDVFLWHAPAPNPGPPLMTTAEAWDTLDALDADRAYQCMGCLLAHPGRAVTVIGDGFRGMAAEQAKIQRWVAELDHDEFRVREAARRSLLKTGLRGAAALNDPGRKKMGVEGETRVRLILEALEAQGMRVPESGLFGEPLRMVRGVRVLETIGLPAARQVLEEAAKGPADSRLTREAKAALETFPRP